MTSADHTHAFTLAKATGSSNHIRAEITEKGAVLSSVTTIGVKGGNQKKKKKEQVQVEKKTGFTINFASNIHNNS